jgi:REP element-mobilizing transposase RayT
MPRAPRVYIEGGIYHVYNRVTRGERVFAEDGEAQRLVDVMREIKQRDEFVVLAWCVMSNHYHLAIRCTSAPLWRSLASVQLKVSRAYNSHYRVHGPFWQGRYKAKLVENPEYLRQLILYIHLNPVVAGIVEEPGEFVWSGHREIVRKPRNPFVDPDQLLLVFGETRRSARKNYLESIRSTRDAPWAGEAPGRLPWWKFGRPREEENGEELVMSATPFIDELGRSTAIERPGLNESDFVDRVLDALDIDFSDITGRTKRHEVVRAREILLTLGIERYRFGVKGLASALGVRYDTASLWGRRGAKRRAEDDQFRRRIDEVDGTLAASPPTNLDALEKRE